MTVFYAQAFDTLYAIHDSENKLQFKRKHHAELPPDMFRKVIEAFCYLSRRNHDYEFTHNSLIDYIGKAIKIAGADAEAKDVLNDLVQNVCILQPEGISFSFVHRSFQDYFSACFALKYSGESPFTIMDTVIEARSESSVGKMMQEMDRAKLNRVWMLPKLNQLVKYLEDIKEIKLSDRLSHYFGQLMLTGDRASGMSFGGSGKELYKISDSLQPFVEKLIATSFIITDSSWLDVAKAEAVYDAAAEGKSGFTASIDGSERRAQVVPIPETEEWFKGTKIAEFLDGHLDMVKEIRSAVKQEVDQQDQLEAKLLGL